METEKRTVPSTKDPASDGADLQHDSHNPVLFLDVNEIKLQGLEDPRNWSHGRKWCTTAIISLMGFISPLGSSILVPGARLVDLEYSLRSRTISLLPISLFVLGLGIGPFLLAPASELRGRLPIYLISSIIFVLFNVATALVRNYVGLCILRFLAGAAGSTGPSLGAGSISGKGDMFIPSERGRAQSLYGLGPLLGPVCGAIAGGWIAQTLHSWRWQLWVLTILSGLITVIVAVFLRETYGPVLLQRKVKTICKQHYEVIKDIIPNNDQDREALKEHQNHIYALAYPNRNKSEQVTDHSTFSKFLQWVRRMILPSPLLRSKLKVALSRPFRLLFTNPICAIFSLYMGYVYGIIFIFLTQHPLLYQERNDPDDPPPWRLPTYNWQPGPTSLTYIGLGLGFLVAASINVMLQDSIYTRLVLNRGEFSFALFGRLQDIARYAEQREKRTQKATEPADVEQTADKRTSQSIAKGRPEYRLPLCAVGMIILPCGLLIFGWTAFIRSHWIFPLIGSFFVGVGSILPFQVILVYLVDTFIPYSASATACAVLVRCILAAVFPLFSESLFMALGFGWGSTLLAFIAMGAIPVPIILWFRGEQLRNRFKFHG